VKLAPKSTPKRRGRRARSAHLELRPGCAERGYPSIAIVSPRRSGMDAEDCRLLARLTNHVDAYSGLRGATTAQASEQIDVMPTDPPTAWRPAVRFVSSIRLAHVGELGQQITSASSPFRSSAPGCPVELNLDGLSSMRWSSPAQHTPAARSISAPNVTVWRV